MDLCYNTYIKLEFKEMPLVEKKCKMDKSLLYEKVEQYVLDYKKFISLLIFDTNELQSIKILLEKIISNIESANYLIRENKINEAKIVLNSSLKTVVLVIYLCCFPSKVEEYLADSQLLTLEKDIDDFVMAINDEKEQAKQGITRLYLIKEYENNFNRLVPLAKEKILKIININQFKCDDEILAKLSIFFKDFNPFFLNLEFMSRELKNNGYNIEQGANKLEIESIILPLLNKTSKIIDGSFLEWQTKKILENESKELFLNINRSVFPPIYFLKRIVKPCNNMQAEKVYNRIGRQYNALDSFVYDGIIPEISYEKKVVFFIDILAFKSMIEGEGENQENKKTANEIYKLFDDMQKHSYEFNSVNSNMVSNIKITHFSDSLIISFGEEDKFNIFGVIYSILRLQYWLLKNHKVLLRGGCAYEELLHNDNRVFGKGLNSAYNLESKFAKNPRIIIPEEIINECCVNNETRENLKELLAKDDDGFWYVDYINIKHLMSNEEKLFKEYLTCIKEIIKNNINNDDESIRKKYLWLQSKYNEVQY